MIFGNVLSIPIKNVKMKEVTRYYLDWYDRTNKQSWARNIARFLIIWKFNFTGLKHSTFMALKLRVLMIRIWWLTDEKSWYSVECWLRYQIISILIHSAVWLLWANTQIDSPLRIKRKWALDQITYQWDFFSLINRAWI